MQRTRQALQPELESPQRKPQNAPAPEQPNGFQSPLLLYQRQLGNQAVQRLHRTGVIQTKLKIGRPNDEYEQEADRVADQVMRMGETAVPLKTPLSTPTSAGSIQRQEDKTSAVLSEGATVAYEQLQEQPGFEAWQKQQTDKLKLKLWDSQPAEAKAGIIGFGLLNLGLLGTAFALDPRFRSDTINTLQDTNLLFLPNLLPYSEYATLSSFKYNLPTAQFAPYTFETEFSFDAWFKLMRDKWNIPQVGLSVGIDSAYSESAGFSPVTGGNFKLKFGGGIVNLSGFYNQALPPTPMLISDPTAGEPPMWIMRSLPGQLEENLPQGSGIFLTVDVLRLPQLFNPPSEQPAPIIQRMPNDSVDTGQAQRQFGNQDVQQLYKTGVIQTKLEIGQPDDKYEQEADQIAEQVMRMPDPASPASDLQHFSHAGQRIQRELRSPVAREEGLELLEKEAVQTKLKASRTARPTKSRPSQIASLGHTGQPLPQAARAFMEPRFNQDFSNVRVHSGARADRMARAFNARAFTFGRHIVFGASEYAPDTTAGRRLLAHELTHVIQQQSARAATGAQTIQRVVWHPNRDTGSDTAPWSSLSYTGDVLEVRTDRGVSIDAWRPHDGRTYWCHGYTFGGSTARGGPYSIWGSSVPTVLNDDGWQRSHSCMSGNGDILVFYDDHGRVLHSGIIRTVSAPGGRVDERASTLESKWGPGSHNTKTWLQNVAQYGRYRSYSRTALVGVCSNLGANELPW
ncbi:MAG: DUF4157 domain-containing protein [Chloroflexi bacterium]|nr:DUF4157 domain-containing protein [Chloroflexota bacterium]